MVDINSIKNFNTRLSNHKAEYQRVQIAYEAKKTELASRLEYLTNMLGKPVTVENINEIYVELSNEIEQQLTNGNSILDRIEGIGNAQPEVVANNVQAAPVQTPVQPAVQPAPAVAQVQTPVQTVQNVGAAVASSLNNFSPAVGAVGNAQPMQAPPVGAIGGIPQQQPVQQNSESIFQGTPGMGLDAFGVLGV